MPDIETPIDETTEVTTEETAETDIGTAEPEGGEGDTFPRKVVEDLRRESAGYRDRAKAAEARADELARQLHTALVAATGKLADAGDLAFDAEHLGDAAALSAAIDTLTDAKPHLKARRVSGDVGQGSRGTGEEPTTLLGLLKRA